MKNHIDSNFAIAILALISACIGFAFWFLHVNNEIISEATVGVDLPRNATQATKDGSVYTDHESKFSLSYPPGYILQKYESSYHPPGYVQLHNDNDECHPITITKYENVNNLSQVIDIPTAKNNEGLSVFAPSHVEYHYRDLKEVVINNQPFITSYNMPYVITVATIIDRWIIEIETADRYNGAYIPPQCQELYTNILNTFSLIQ